MDYSALHDATLQNIQLEWAEGTARLEVIYFSNGARRNGALLGSGVSGITCPRAFPWGESQSINSVSLDERVGRPTLIVEMQSGDAILIEAAAFSFEQVPEHLTEEIIVLVKHQGNYRWFVSERDFWVLDWNSWHAAFLEKGYEPGDPSSAERFGIAVVSESNATEFLGLMEVYSADIDLLRGTQTIDGDIAYPSLFVDFDKKEIIVCGVESPAFEDYLPPGWRAEFRSFLDRVPAELRFWDP